MNLFRINEGNAPAPEPDPQLSLFEEPSPQPDGEMDAAPHFVIEPDEESKVRYARETFLVSLIVHVAVILFLATHPELIHLGSSPPIVLLQPEAQQVTMLYDPPPPRPKLEAPPTPPPPPMRLPQMEGSVDSQLQQPAPPPAARFLEPPAPRPVESREPEGSGKDQQAKTDAFGIPQFPEIAKAPPERQPSLESLPQPRAPRAREDAGLRLPNLAPPSRGTDAILRDMAKQHAEGGGKGIGSGANLPDAGDPNFNLPGPQILSDTMGVDFDPYLMRVYLIVQRNWYAVIPEIARLGRKGRVVLQFSIQKAGGVLNLRMMDGSGTGSMDLAALSSIRLSNPFPPLPADFPGNEILLRFGYYYNMQPEY